MPEPEVIIVGGGLAGLTCARHLHRQGVSFLLFEASDRVGGRVRTDTVDGFTLDRGFQVLLSAYPETQRELDYDALDLQAFYEGALVRLHGRFHTIGDPFRHPLDMAETLLAPVGALTDKLRIARLRHVLTHEPLWELFMRDERTTMEVLRDRWHFSPAIINRFFRPFFGGIFFDHDLQASSRMFEFVFRMFAKGQAVLPAEGMEALPRQLAADLPAEAIRVNAEVTAIDAPTVTLAEGATHTAPAIVVATEAPVANRLVGGVTPTEARTATCLYYATQPSPLDHPMLVLNGDGQGPINNLSVLSDVAPRYAPDGQALISVVVLDPAQERNDDALEHAVQRQLIDWFGHSAETWRHLRTYRIPYALPEQRPPFLSPPMRPARHGNGVYLCGDHRRTASLNGAIASGRAAAEAVLEDHPALAA